MKTKQELLKIYSSYLPYELEIKYKDFPNEKIIRKAILSGVTTTEIETTYKRKIKGCKGDIISWQGNNNIFDLEVKPILYSMEMLTQEIEHKGEMFVPKKRLGFNENDILCLKAWGEYSGRLLHKDFEQLVEWNFNVFGLEESEYIKKETLNRSENPNS